MHLPQSLETSHGSVRCELQIGPVVCIPPQRPLCVAFIDPSGMFWNASHNAAWLITCLAISSHRMLPCRYGYSFGSSAADVWHKVNFEAMLYPGYTTYGE